MLEFRTNTYVGQAESLVEGLKSVLFWIRIWSEGLVEGRKSVIFDFGLFGRRVWSRELKSVLFDSGLFGRWVWSGEGNLSFLIPGYLHGGFGRGIEICHLCLGLVGGFGRGN